MKRKLSVHPLVEKELERGAAWYNQDAGGGELGYRLARRFLAYYDSVLAEIEEDPERWNGNYRNFRRRVFTGWPYTMVYYVTDAEVRIVALAHVSKKPHYWRRRR